MTNKKKVFVVAVAVCLIAILSLSSLAWFSDADEVTNNFQVAGGENEDPDEIFSIDVMEAVDLDGDGKVDATVGYDKDPEFVNEALYENIMPGDMLLKRPQAKNTGSYAQWVRFKVTIDNASDWVAVMQKYGYELHDLLYMKDGVTKLTEADNWTFVPEQTTVTDDKVTYVFYYNEILEPGKTAILFGNVKIPFELNQYDMALFAEGKFQMVVTGEAIQAEHTGDNAVEAFALVETTQAIK